MFGNAGHNKTDTVIALRIFSNVNIQFTHQSLHFIRYKHRPAILNDAVVDINQRIGMLLIETCTYRASRFLYRKQIHIAISERFIHTDNIFDCLSSYVTGIAVERIFNDLLLILKLRRVAQMLNLTAST